MKNLSICLSLCFLSLSLSAQVTQEWEATTPGLFLSPWNKGIVLDNAGNIYLAGSYADGSSHALQLQKYDAAGTLLWTQSYLPAGSTTVSARAMAMDSNGDILISGVIDNTTEIGFIRKYDQAGQLLWSQSSNFSNYSLTTDEFNNVYVTSWDFPQGSMKINKYDNNGNLLWSVNNNVTTTGGGHGKLYYKNGFLYRTGGIWLKINARDVPAIYTLKYNALTGAQVWVKTYYHADKISQSGWDVVADDAGNVYVSGYVYTKSGKNHNTNWATLKYNSAGTQQWVTFYDGNGNDYIDPRTNASTGSDFPIGMTIDNSGNIIITGESCTTTGQFTSQDMTTIKYNPAGSAVWVRTYDSPAHGKDGGVAITTDASANVYITGRTNATTIKYNAAGVQQWLVNYTGGTTTNVQVDNSGNVYAGGNVLIKYSQGAPVTRKNSSREENINKISLYPNPATDHIIIRNDKVLGTITVYDVSGKNVYQQFVGNSQTVVDLLRLSPGIYFLKADAMEKAIRFVKQ
jgi:hypothetical protein